MRGSGQDGHQPVIRLVYPQMCQFFGIPDFQKTASVRIMLPVQLSVLLLQMFMYSFLFLFRWNGGSAVNDASVPAGSCWKHERHDEFQQHVTANQEVALNHKSCIGRPQPPPSCTPLAKDFFKG